MTGTYGWAESNNKGLTWELMRNLNLQDNSPWALLGDLNEVLYETKKNGRNPCDLGSVQQFFSVVDKLGLKDTIMEGYAYTWSNKREGNSFLEEKLDRVLANNEWLSRLPIKLFGTDRWLHDEGFDNLLKDA
ncbi:Pyridoxal phosphate homeostasis protein [Bienertia sinuspersici]